MHAVAVSLVLLVAQGIDLGPLLRNLLDGRGGGRDSVSKSIRLEAEDTRRRARLRVLDEADAIVLVVQFDLADDHLLPHTVQLEIDGTTTTLRVLDLQLSRDRRQPETVVALLPEPQLEGLAAAAHASLTLKGWDETFAATLGDKDLRKISSFYERRRADESGD